jgi:hypothetical protein
MKHFLNNFSKNPKISNFTKIRPVADEFFHSGRQEDGQANITKPSAPRPLPLPQTPGPRLKHFGYRTP